MGSMDQPMQDVPREQSLIDYPSRFPIKVMGLNADGFVHAVTEIARRFDPAFDAASIELRPSSGSKYLGVTITVNASNSTSSTGRSRRTRW
jgi:putative lipoic acid-binding regulatory protein